MEEYLIKFMVRKSEYVMTFEHIKCLLQISYTFNTSSIHHSFAIGDEEIIRVTCLLDTFILEVTSSAIQQTEHYLSIDEAAQALYAKINARK